MQSATVQAISRKEFQVASNLLPTKIEGTFDLPKISELILVVGRKTVCAGVEFELIHLASRMSVGGNLTNTQITFIADQLVQLFPNETLGDFKLCFQRGSIGLYGDIQRMDGITIGAWMKKYLDEKYEILEDMLRNEKDKHPYELASSDKVGHAPIKDGMPAPPEVAQKYIDEMKEALSNRVSVPGLTDDEIKKNGRETPPRRKASSYDYTDITRYTPKQLELVRRQQIKDMYGDLPEEKVKEILNELNQLEK